MINLFLIVPTWFAGVAFAVSAAFCMAKGRPSAWAVGTAAALFGLSALIALGTGGLPGAGVVAAATAGAIVEIRRRRPRILAAAIRKLRSEGER